MSAAQVLSSPGTAQPTPARAWLRAGAMTALTSLGVCALLFPFLENRFLDLLVSTEVVGFTLLLLVRPAMQLALPIGWRLLAVTGALAGGAFVGTVLVVLIKGRSLTMMFSDIERMWSFALTMSLGILFGLIAVAVAATRARIAEADSRAARAEAERQALARQTAEAQLQVLRAQIEPHFLINTLANVAALIEASPSQASAMLENLIDYLQAAMPRIRGTDSTVRNELAMASAYIAILQIRMGQRLDARFDVPPELLGKSLPPMMLLTLVENAIEHGLKPKPAGGEIHITARAEGGTLRLCVLDTGVGLAVAADASGGVGLANIRSRLHAMYGTAAGLTLAAADGGGTRACLTLPLESAGETHPA